MDSQSLSKGVKKPVIRIQPPSRWVSLDFKELWEYRELLFILVWRDIKLRYKQTVLGVAWVVLQPFLTMVVFSLLFGVLAGLPSQDLPYTIFTYTALLPWQLFANALTQSGNSLVMSQSLITKIYFPRVVIPLSPIVAGLLDFAIAFVMLIGMMIFYKIVPTIAVLTLPLFILLAIVTAFAVGLWLSALNVEYRDVRYAIPFLVQFWFFITPVSYSIELIPEKWRTLYALNPMVGVVEGFRWALLGQELTIGPIIIASAISVVVILVSGLFYFRRMEDRFADVV